MVFNLRYGAFHGPYEDAVMRQYVPTEANTDYTLSFRYALGQEQNFDGGSCHITPWGLAGPLNDGYTLSEPSSPSAYTCVEETLHTAQAVDVALLVLSCVGIELVEILIDDITIFKPCPDQVSPNPPGETL